MSLWFWSAQAWAHDPPQADDVAWSADGRALVVTNRGLILGRPPDGEARMLCIEALGLSTSEHAQAMWTSSGDLIVAGASGLQRSTDGGCSIKPVDRFDGVQITAMAAPRRAADRLFVAAFDAEAGGIYRSDDGATTFTRVLELGDDDYVYSLRMAPSDPETVYASGWQFGSGDSDLRYLRRSTDAGASWDRFELPLTDDEEHAEITAVHPTDPNDVVLHTVVFDPDVTAERVLSSTDGGASFEEILQVRKVRGGSYRDGGQELWIAAREGLWRARGSEPFMQLSGPQEMSCVQADGDRMLACGHYEGVGAGHDGVGILDPETGAFSPWLDFSDVEGLLDCPPATTATVLCAGGWWGDWAREVGSAPDGTMTGATADAAVQEPEAGVGPGVPVNTSPENTSSPAPQPKTSGPAQTPEDTAGGCSVAPAGGGACGGFAPWLALAWIARRRRVARASSPEAEHPDQS